MYTTVSGMPMLWFTAPARAWEESFPVGNGRLGAMVRGGRPAERIALNEDTFWSGPGERALPQVPHGLLAEVRALIEAGRHAEAGEALRATQGADAEAFQPVGHLEIEHLEDAPPDVYRRSLDLREGVAATQWESAGLLVRQEVLASAVDQVIAVRLETGHPQGLHLRIGLGSPQPRSACRVDDDGRLSLLLAAPRHVVPWPRTDGVISSDDEVRSVRAAAMARILVEPSQESSSAESCVVAGESSIEVRDAVAVTIFVAIRTGFTRWDALPTDDAEACLRNALLEVNAAADMGWEAVRARHVSEHRELMDRVTLRLETGQAAPDVPIDERLARRAAGESDEDLAAAAFAFGRYLLAASSRPGTQAATLQGIWNEQIAPPWNSQYTTNINVQMNYWPAEVAALPECHDPLLGLVADLAEAGRETARQLYGARGWTCHHNTDLWRITVPVGAGAGDPKWAQWPMAGAWLSLHLAERWRFGRDLDHLERQALPIAVDAARFVLDLLVPNEDGDLVVSPSTSPENCFVTEHGVAGVDRGTSSDRTLARELFGFVLEAAAALTAAGRAPAAEDQAAIGEVRDAFERLAPLCIGSRGQVLEWSGEWEETEPHHRHVSHLIGLYPGSLLATDPRLREAARTTLHERGDEGTGWSIVWKIALWARLRDGAAAHRLLGHYLRPVTPNADGGWETAGGVYTSLLCAHPPFQIDGNLGVTAAIAELLLQSHEIDDDGTPILDLLPALPPAWTAGTVTGLRARGGVTLEHLSWRDGHVESAALHAAQNTTVVIRYQGTNGQSTTRSVSIKADQTEYVV
ncbi:glycoside hydrolase family 95 protein [Actinospica robiniae]|uniref:glycoside hydrolase family 95 protein n=1 Tax=Actinospica robiniae TaxID=304901 RepID=UPI000427EA51|nr:glycoside hydrolase family 95 protein [Actinospica robiniae]